MAQQTGKQITLEIGADELRFNVDLTAFNGFQNEFLPNNKVAPSHNFLMKTVHPDDRETLTALLDQGMAIHLAQAVAGGFTPEVEIRVKK